MKNGKVKAFKDSNGEWQVRVVASNGNELTRTTEGYKNKDDALQAVRSAAIIAVKALFCAVLLLALPARAGLTETFTRVFDVSDTNSLVNAGEVSFTPMYVYNSQLKLHGAALRADWWTTQQLGWSLRYTGFQRDSARVEARYWSFGGQARTLFGPVEVGFGTGVTQDVDDTLGARLRAYINPGLTYKKAFGGGKVAVLVHAGAMVYSAERPELNIGIGFDFNK